MSLMLKRILLLLLAILNCIKSVEQHLEFILPDLNKRKMEFQEINIAKDLEAPAKHCSLLKEYIYDENAICINGISLSEKSIAMATMLTLHCDEDKKPNDLDQSLVDLTNFERIKELKIVNCPIEKVPKLPKQLSRLVLERVNYLQEISLPITLESLLEVEIRTSSSLESLSISSMIRKLTISDAPRLCECDRIRTLPRSLRILSLNQIGKTKKKPLCLNKKLILERSLGLLDLSDNFINDLNNLLGNGHIERLHLNHIQDSQSNPFKFYSCNEILRSLKELELSEIGYRGILDFYNHPDGNERICFQSLVKLNLSGNLIDELNLEDLNNPQLRKLTHLELSHNQIKNLPIDRIKSVNNLMNRNPLVLNIEDNQINANCKTKDFLDIIDQMKFVRLKSNCKTMAVELHGSTNRMERYTRIPCDNNESLKTITQTKNLMCLSPLKPGLRLNEKSSRKIMEIKEKYFSVQNDSPQNDGIYRSVSQEIVNPDGVKTIDLTNANDNLGDEVLCETTGDPKPNISWYLMDKGNKIQKIQISNNKSLTLSWELIKRSAIIDKEEAIFLCIAKNDVGQSVTALKVLLPKVITETLRRNHMIQNESGAVGQYHFVIKFYLMSITIFYTMCI